MTTVGVYTMSKLLLAAIVLLCATATSSAIRIQTDDLISVNKYSACEAFEVHLALTDDPSSVRISWRTSSPSCDALVYYDVLASSKSLHSDDRHGDPDVSSTTNNLQSASGDSYTFTESKMCSGASTKKRFAVNMHVAELTGLLPETHYWYRIQGSLREFVFKSPVLSNNRRRGQGMSSVFINSDDQEQTQLQQSQYIDVVLDDRSKSNTTQYNFNSEITAQPGSSSFSFIAFGDMGESRIRKRKSSMADATLRTLQSEVERRPVDFIVHIGDLAYADGRHTVWDSFMESIEQLSSRIPYMVGVGNHEYGYLGRSNQDPSGVERAYQPSWGNFADDSGGECGAMLANRFTMPNRRDSSKDNAPFWYTFSYATVQFVIISSEHDISPGSVQYRWLARTLASVDRCATPWVVLGLHRPMYVAYPHKDNRVVGDHLRDFIEDLLIEYQVDLTVSGHVHTYYRTCPVKQEVCRQDGSGTTHFVIGSGGHALSGMTDEQKSWMSAGINDWGFVRFDVEDDTAMTARFISSKTGDVLDKVTMASHLSRAEACGSYMQAQPARLQALEKKLLKLQEQYEQERDRS